MLAYFDVVDAGWKRARRAELWGSAAWLCFGGQLTKDSRKCGFEG